MARETLLEPFAPEAAETPFIQELDRVLSREQASPRLVSASGDELALPASVYKLLKSIVHLMASGQAIRLIPAHLELTTQEAAGILNVSRPHVVKLLESRALPCRKVGSHRRIRFEDLMVYKRIQEVERVMALAEMTKISQEDGIY
ncbi:MAG TPA: helix-turn-helix domain-containing protein [Oscillatoriaceae cyanobacterium]